MAAAKTGNWLLNVNFIGNFEILKQHILTQISVENMQYRGDYVCIIKYEHKTTKTDGYKYFTKFEHKLFKSYESSDPTPVRKLYTHSWYGMEENWWNVKPECTSFKNPTQKDLFICTLNI